MSQASNVWGWLFYTWTSGPREQCAMFCFDMPYTGLAVVCRTPGVTQGHPRLPGMVYSLQRARLLLWARTSNACA